MANYVLLERIELNASAASVTFINIPQSGYTDLKIVSSTRADGSFTQAQFNGDTGANYSMRFVRGNGTTAATNTSTIFGVGTTNDPSYTPNTFSNDEVYIPNYNVSGIQKSGSTDSVMENNATANYMPLIASRWTGTAAITSIKLQPQSGGLFAQYSTFSLYGLAATGTTPAIYPLASGGDIIQTDGTYWYHAFLSSSKFTPLTTLSCDLLIVAGGGGGAGAGYVAANGGGGGAGGLLGFTSQSLVATNYTVVVGAGGASGAGGNNSPVIPASNGADSKFGTLTTAIGGGRGASFASYTSTSGGSGGGGADGSATLSGSSGTSGQGNAGGNGSSYQGPSGGGGGAGSAGSSSTPGAGATYNTTVSGSGPYSFIDAMGSATGTGQLSSSHYYYAGGGAGAYTSGITGGVGGGGASGYNANGTAGTASTGGGGGGVGENTGSSYWYGGNGGSGIVIVRYAV